MNEDNFKTSLFLGSVKKNPIGNHPKRDLFICLLISTGITIAFATVTIIINTAPTFVFFAIPLATLVNAVLRAWPRVVEPAAPPEDS